MLPLGHSSGFYQWGVPLELSITQHQFIYQLTVSLELF
ncbi:hypothetical protein BHF72_2515 [Cloacibacterium normanense]|uniref:Uncharacterized protein n=1 Tax=Cloacibacterium normanense TaxID=237258 RepID=A0A1E5UDS9_9FLAO|nr:hypothetical protein BHF72_2515 [Cloacibacterium normanense]